MIPYAVRTELERFADRGKGFSLDLRSTKRRLISLILQYGMRRSRRQYSPNSRLEKRHFHFSERPALPPPPSAVPVSPPLPVNIQSPPPVVSIRSPPPSAPSSPRPLSKHRRSAINPNCRTSTRLLLIRSASIGAMDYGPYSAVANSLDLEIFWFRLGFTGSRESSTRRRRTSSGSRRAIRLVRVFSTRGFDR